MAYTSTFATVVVVLRRAIPVYHGERPAICPKKNRVEPVDCDGTTANEPLAKSRYAAAPVNPPEPVTRIHPAVSEVADNPKRFPTESTTEAPGARVL